MAVEKMEMVNIIGQMDLIDDVLKKIILSGSLHPVNALGEIQQSNFPITEARDNVDAVIDYNFIKQYTSLRDLNDVQNKIDALYEIFEMKKKLRKEHIIEEYSFERDLESINEIYKSVEEKHNKLRELKDEHDELEVIEDYLGPIKEYDFDLNEAANMKYINLKLGKVTKYNMDKLKKNYENIPAIVLRIDSDINYSKILVLVPRSIEFEVDRILNSLNFNEFKLNVSFEGSPLKWLENISIRKTQILKEIDFIKSQLLSIKQREEKKLEKYYSRLYMEYKLEELKTQMAVTNQFFYLTGWVPGGKMKNLEMALEAQEKNLIIIYKRMDEIREGISPPTCLRNNKLIKPFESVVKMYGVPSYGEIDPTIFVGLSYMLLFGAMFGDVGQGAVLFIVGSILNFKKRRPNLGGVVSRLGISSIVFGFLYGSVFGFEDVLKTYVVKPMMDINFMLIGAVCLGIVLLSIGFVYNLVNSYRNRDLENGVFSRNGLAGLAFYWILLYLVIARVYNKKTILPSQVLVILLIALLLLTLLKEPITNLIKGVRPLYSESKTDYYIEGGFGVIETLLSLFSNTVSFIRVGAFAINHVGLFIAFDTLAHMVGSGVQSAIVIVIGNIVIIGLEGLIVFIQGLRLEYYELFSKYFSGAGYEYKAIEI